MGENMNAVLETQEHPTYTVKKQGGLSVVVKEFYGLRRLVAGFVTQKVVDAAGKAGASG